MLKRVLSLLVLPVFGCDLVQPDPLPPRGDEEIIEKAGKVFEGEGSGPGHEDCREKRTFYRDNDGDGFGDPKHPVKACHPPPGYVDNADDCYDDNSDVNPKQRRYFHVHRGDGSFDYDCDGKEKRRIMERAFCRVREDGGGCFFASGWHQSTIPQCGEAGVWKWYECDEIHQVVPPKSSGDGEGEPSTEKENKKREKEGVDDGRPRKLETTVHYRCRGNILPWKKMQLCR